MADVKTKQPKPDMPFPPELFEGWERLPLIYVFVDERRTIIWGCQGQKWLQ